ncbi:glycosyltransferase family 2 protein [Lonepinella sp. BR2882]|uniref:glycosyltransferase family 2 protein n=1 Tax=Lonepinella sp. BR2882 TaxID=3095283 RepID=UPI003F6E43E7
MINSVKIAILMATYNGGKFLEEQLLSIISSINKLNNTFDVDIIISDDASIDDTREIIERVKQIHYKKIILLNMEKKGSAVKNFSFLISKVSCEYDYYFFSDQDDYWNANKLVLFLETLRSVDNSLPVLVHSDLSIVDTNLSLISDSMFDYQKLNKNSKFENLIVQNSITGCVVAINKELLKLARSSSISNSIMHDWYLGLIASSMGRIYFIDQPTILYRQHGYNEVGAKGFNIYYILRKLLSFRKTYVEVHKSIKNSKEQARLFLSDFNFLMDLRQRETLLNYINCPRWNFIEKISLIRKGYKKNGIIRNFIYFFL